MKVSSFKWNPLPVDVSMVVFRTGEKLYSLPMEMAAVAAAAAEEVASCQSTETDDTIGNSTTLPTMEDDGSTTSSVPEGEFPM